MVLLGFTGNLPGSPYASDMVFFQHVLFSFQRFSILFWLPVMLIEALVLLVAVKRLAEKFTGRHETMKLDI